MTTTRQRVAALALCALALASVAAVATAPAAAQSDDGVSNTTDATNATGDLTLDAAFAAATWPSSDVTVSETHNPLTLTANRANYTVTVRSEELDSSTLADVFADELATDDPAVADFGETEGGLFRMRVLDRNATILANFTTAVTQPYTFEFEAGNATATATTEIVRCECVGAGFLADGRDGATFTAEQSSVVTVPVGLKNTDQAELEIDGDDLEITGTVVDGNDDDRVTLVLNTHLIGRNGPFDDHARPYWTRRGLSVRDSADGLESVRVPEVPGGDYPMDTEEFDVTIRDDDETLATTTLTITERSGAALDSRVGPAGLLTNVTAADLRSAVADGALTADETVPNGSALVYEIESPSLFGPLRTAASGYASADRYTQAFLDTVTDRNDSVIPGDAPAFDIDGPSNARIDLLNTSRNDGLVVVPDRENATLYVGVRTDRLAVANGTALGSGETFTASFGVYDRTASEAVQFADGADDESGTPAPPSPEPPATPEQGTSPSPDAGDTPSPETAAPPADDPTEGSPDATTTATGPGFGVAAVVAALLAVSSLAAGRRRD
ncbi:DUF7827 domain-containing protein [Halorientalis regularis]|uniref:DUF7827 domain-containing protein n=1 Tax=Halorientalis regularis TaxID=660518 RepID=A0A1G7JQN6_9EURY|nr:hypothetical protein [Halorientalis regularis]SDF27257.1 hypothetical protein SAMN05216218_10531 [Halorientalis regularis]